MRELFHKTMTVLEHALRQLEPQVPLPRAVPFKGGVIWRYAERSVEQALIQKLARNISSLHAIDVLLLHGLLQEQGAMHRVLDELHEDVTFLSTALINDELTPRHHEYLAAFYAEEMHDHSSPAAQPPKPNTVERKKIRAYAIRELGGAVDPSTAAAAGASISRGYSGYIHAGSSQTMEMYEGQSARFHVSGIRGNSLWNSHLRDAWNYFYRSLMSADMIALAFGDKSLDASLKAFILQFEAESGTNYFNSAAPAVK